MIAQDKIICYVRPWNRDQFLELAHGAWPDSELVVISEHQSVDENDFAKQIYLEYRAQEECAGSGILSDAEVDDIILRCRLLRVIDKDKAKRMVSTATQVVERLFDQHSPKAVISITVDSYLLHIMALACARRGVPFVGLIPSFVNGHFRITALGERIVARRVTDREVEEALGAMLSSTYKPSFLVQSTKEMYKKAFTTWLRNLVKPLWFSLFRRLKGDSLNYHYYSSEVVAKQYRSIFPVRYKGVAFRSKSGPTLSSRCQSLIYLPLQMSPEATIDYWCSDKSWIDYEKKILDVVGNTKEDIVFLIKEHPNVLGNRTPNFYRKLSRMKNCILIAPEVPSNLMLDICDAVLFGTGTVGFEAVLRGIPVYSDNVVFHTEAERVLPTESLKNGIQERKKLTKEEQSDIVRFALEGLLPGCFVNNGTWLPEHNDQSQIINSIRRFNMEGEI
tara:strand:- start:16852 stop:18195 length:1344 start_codon:yes stop_codon:yes gene_type:complete